MKEFFCFDVESVGLFGEGCAVGGGIYNLHNSKARDEFLIYCSPDRASGPADGHAWLAKNMPQFEGLSRTLCPTPREVRARFWEVLMRACSEGVTDIVVDCGWPVEAQFLLKAREENSKIGDPVTGPYPLLDVSTALLCCHLDPTGYYDRRPDELPLHNPLNDARQSARLWRQCMEQLREK